MDDRLISAPKLQDRHDISHMTLWRRLNDPKLNFPRPLIINRRRYFRLSEIEAWEAAHLRAQEAA